MYVTPLDYKAELLNKSLFNHKKFRPKVVYDNVELFHLLIPDVELYIFNFIFDSKQYTINPQLYDIDIICKQTYDDAYAYPLITYINGVSGIQKLANTTVFIPNRLVEFVNKFGNKYDGYVEKALDETGLEQQETYTTQESSSIAQTVSAVFGQLFAEA